MCGVWYRATLSDPTLKSLFVLDGTSLRDIKTYAPFGPERPAQRPGIRFSLSNILRCIFWFVHTWKCLWCFTYIFYFHRLCPYNTDIHPYHGLGWIHLTTGYSKVVLRNNLSFSAWISHQGFRCLRYWLRAKSMKQHRGLLIQPWPMPTLCLSTVKRVEGWWNRRLYLTSSCGHPGCSEDD